MQKLVFHSNNRHTLGVELELGLVDDESMELTSAIDHVLEKLDADSAQFKPELMQCCLEINSGICETVADAEVDLKAKIRAG